MRNKFTSKSQLRYKVYPDSSGDDEYQPNQRSSQANPIHDEPLAQGESSQSMGKSPGVQENTGKPSTITKAPQNDLEEQPPIKIETPEYIKQEVDESLEQPVHQYQHDSSMTIKYEDFQYATAQQDADQGELSSDDEVKYDPVLLQAESETNESVQCLQESLKGPYNLRQRPNRSAVIPSTVQKPSKSNKKPNKKPRLTRTAIPSSLTPSNSPTKASPASKRPQKPERTSKQTLTSTVTRPDVPTSSESSPHLPMNPQTLPPPPPRETQEATTSVNRSTHLQWNNHMQQIILPQIPISSGLTSSNDNFMLSCFCESKTYNPRRFDVSLFPKDNQERITGKDAENFNMTCWSLSTSRLHWMKDKGHVPNLLTFVHKYGFHVNHLVWDNDISGSKGLELMDIFSSFIQALPQLGKLTFHYNSQQDIPHFIYKLSELYKSGNGNPKNLTALQFISFPTNGGVEGIGKSAINALVQSQIPFRGLEFDQLQQEQPNESHPEFFQELLESYKDTLMLFSIKESFIGSKPPSLHIKFPVMRNLQILEVCQTTYARMARFELQKDLEGSVELEFPEDLPYLHTLTLGASVQVKQIPWSIVQRLKVFHCQHQWNQCLQFPEISTLPQHQLCQVTHIHFPTRLLDLTFVPKVLQFFPNLKSVSIDLPTQTLLHTFFIHFADSKVEELNLQFQFDYEFMLEPCLFPQHYKEKTRPEFTKKESDILDKYTWIHNYNSHLDVERPLEEGDAVERSAEGLLSLKHLKKLHLHYVGRSHSPSPKETRDWNSSKNPLVILRKLGSHRRYSVAREFNKRILDLKLQDYSRRSVCVLMGVLTSREDRGRYLWEVRQNGSAEDIRRGQEGMNEGKVVLVGRLGAIIPR